MPRLEDYRPVVGEQVLSELRVLARSLKGRSVQHVNSTAVGGGVAEILNRMVPLMNELEIPTSWDVVKGGEAFYAVTKKFHNALHGDPVDVTPKDYQVFEDTTDENLGSMNLGADFVFIHDPQPCALVKSRRKMKNRWLWRCHIDVSRRHPGVWEFLKPYVEQYDASVISAPSFAQAISIRQALVAPSIDPLSDKNRELTREEIRAVLERLEIPTDKPLVTQVSRFDRLKDPLGVIEAFQIAKRSVDARLLLVGGSADDDPEGSQVLAEVRERAKDDPDILVLCLPPTSHVEINAIQRASAVIVQKSLREGFGLTVSEALWKGKPVIAGAVGGIPLQVIHKQTGALVHTIEGAARWIRRLLTETAMAKRLGESGREHVRNNFLLTRHLRDYMLLFLSAEHGDENFIRLN
jgi:trehalose synthase